MSVGDDIKTGLKEAIELEQRNKIAKDLCSKYNICTCNNRDGHCSIASFKPVLISSPTLIAFYLTH